ncbi:Transmembrane_domain-containing protein [Hexamita inflata]|uniref:Transmembrane domain-containing protein n=1 Tax=Hexamita inflata TaxID=28002 RepID=A0AA86UBU5_9EUKA|nr:Transmembrane domain-containing protein [Hexamita inflata]
MTELLQLISNHFKLNINVRQFGKLLKFNSLPEKCVASLELLNMLKPTLNQEEAIVTVLLCLTQRIMRGAFDDHYIITVQDYLSKMYNDRSPNQRAAMACGWSIITEMNLVDQKFANLYFEIMVCGDSKMYEKVRYESQNKICNYYIHALAWLLCHSPMLVRDSSYHIQKNNYSKEMCILGVLVELSANFYIIIIFSKQYTFSWFQFISSVFHFITYFLNFEPLHNVFSLVFLLLLLLEWSSFILCNKIP